MAFGTVEGERCWRDGCEGVIADRPVKGCRCHISPPCSACTAPSEHCPTCGWEASAEPRDHAIYIDADSGGVRWPGPRPLDPRKIDWNSKGHTCATMIKEGVYPEGTTIAQVEAVVREAFGGRFEYFHNGRFRYIAYTD